MRLKLIEDDKKLQESLSLTGLDTQESVLIPEWAGELIKAESWQASRLEIGQLQKLVERLPEKLFNKENELTWEINKHECPLNVDLSLVLINLATDILLTEIGKETDFLVLE